ncbi:hypothetical protein [Gracilimonas sp.]|uniref:hypothetical protein n=1 Tax=Gracilimonas sp. TaxID=1974203 RepID=UPI0032EFBE77
MNIKNYISLLFILALLIPSSYGSNIYTVQADSATIDKIQMNHRNLATKIDSLQKELDKFQISENYFSSILQSQTAIFTGIVTLLLFFFGLIGWQAYLKKHENRLDILDEWKNNFEKEYQDLRKTSDEIKFNAFRASYHVLENEWKFIYAVRLAEYFVDIKDNKGALTWLGHAKNDFNQVTKIMKLYKYNSYQLLQELEANNDESLGEKARELRKLIESKTEMK